jgi:O-antigen/teichoic acid export membrane protein
MSLKSFSKNTITYALGGIALRFTSFLLIPLYTHYLSKEEFGLLQTVLFTVQVLITLNDVGMRTALIRFFSDYEIKNKLHTLLGSSILIIFTSGLVLIFATFLIPDSFVSEFFNTIEISNIVLLTVFVGLTQTLSLHILSYFRAKEKGKTYAIISFGASIFLLLSTVVFLIVLEMGIIGVLISQILTYGLMWLLIFIWISFKHGLKIELNTLRELFRFGSPLIFAMAGGLIMNTVGIYLLGIFRNLEEVAIFSLAYKVAMICIMLVIGPFQMAYEPFVFKNKNDKDLAKNISKIITYISLIYILTALGILFVFRDFIGIIAPEDYGSSYYLIFLILPGLGFTAFNYIGQSLLHLKNKTKTTGTIVISTTLISLVISYFSVESFGIIGLIFSINFYLILNGLVLYSFGNSVFPIKIERIRLFVSVIIWIFLSYAIYFLSYYSGYIYYPTVSLIFGMAILLLFKSQFFSQEEKGFIDKTFRKVLFFRNNR